MLVSVSVLCEVLSSLRGTWAERQGVHGYCKLFLCTLSAVQTHLSCQINPLPRVACVSEYPAEHLDGPADMVAAQLEQRGGDGLLRGCARREYDFCAQRRTAACTRCWRCLSLQGILLQRRAHIGEHEQVLQAKGWVASGARSARTLAGRALKDAAEAFAHFGSSLDVGIELRTGGLDTKALTTGPLTEPGLHDPLK